VDPVDLHLFMFCLHAVTLCGVRCYVLLLLAAMLQCVTKPCPSADGP
jgi:hypothetical protein